MIDHDRETIDVSESIPTATGMDVASLESTARTQRSYDVQKT